MESFLERHQPDRLIPVVSAQTHWQRAALFLESAIYTCILALLVLTAIPYGTVEPWWLALFECIVFLLGAGWIVEGWMAGAWRVRGRALLLPLVAVAIFAAVQTIPLRIATEVNGSKWNALSADPFETFLFLLRWAAIVMVLALLLRYVSSERRLKILVWVIISIGIASALWGILRQTSESVTPAIFERLKGGRGYGQFVNKNHFGFMLEMALGLVWGLIVGRGAPKEKMLVYLAAALPLWAGLILVNSRGAILAMICAMVFSLLLLPSLRKNNRAENWNQPLLERLLHRKLATLLLIAVLFVGIVGSVLWIGGEPLVTRLEDVRSEFGEDVNRQGVRRMDIWRATIKLIQDHPVAGSGFGAYWMAITPYHDASGRLAPRQAHSDYLEWVAGGGVIALLIGVWFVLAFIRRARRTLQADGDFRRAACFGAIVGIFAIALHSLVEFGLHPTSNALMFVSLIAIAASEVHLNENPSHKAKDLHPMRQNIRVADSPELSSKVNAG